MNHRKSDNSSLRFILSVATVGLTLATAPKASAGTAGYRNLVLGDNPLVYYEFDETTGTTALNSASSGATYDGTFNGTMALGQTSFAFGVSAYDFGGGRVTFGATLGALTEWSVEAWMNYDSAKTSNSHIVGNDMGGWNDDVLIGMGPEGGLGGNGGGQFGVVQQGNPGSVRDGAGAAMTADEWHHVVVTGSTTAGELIVYIDGVAVDTNASLTNGVTFGDNPFVLGDDRAGGFKPYDGLLDEVAIYDSVLTPGQVESHFNGVPEPPSSFKLSISPNGVNYDFSWASQPDKLYDLVSDTVLGTTAPADWPVWLGNADIPSDGTTTMLTDIPGGGPTRFFAVVEKDPPPPPLQNGSFEDPVTVEDTLEPIGAPWVEFDDGDAGTVETWNPLVSEYATVPDGENVATIWFNTVPSAAFGITQVLGETFAAGTDYEVTVQVGRSTTFDWPGFRVELWAGATLLASDEDPTTTAPTAGNFVLSTVSYDDATGTAATPGDALEVRLLSRGVDAESVVSSTNGWSVEFDQVEFTATGP